MHEKYVLIDYVIGKASCQQASIQVFGESKLCRFLTEYRVLLSLAPTLFKGQL